MAASAPAAESDCACTNISIMQLFHELKQKFPAVPDRVVSECIRQNFHDKGTCEAILSRENVSYLLHSYPPSLKMSSSEPESPVSARLHNLTLCDKCTLGRPCTNAPCPPRGQVYESETSNRILNESGVQFLTQGSSQQFTQSANTQALTGNFRSLPQNSDIQSGQANNSVLRSNSSVNSSQQVSCQGGISSKSQFCQEGSNFSSGIPRSEPFSPSDVYNPDLFSSHREEFNTQRYQSSDNAPACFNEKILRQSTTVLHSVGAASSSICQNSCNRPSSLNVGQSNFPQHSQLHSAPVIPSNYEPFHSNNMHPSSACERPGDGSFTAPHIGAHQHLGQSSRQSESSVNNSRSYVPGNGSPNVSKEAEDMYGDRTVVNSYQVNVNCRLQRSRTGSTVNVSGSSTRTVSEGPETHHRARSAIQVQPAPHYTGQNLWAGGEVGGQTPSSVSVFPPQQPRSYTSVNLTLRPPSSEPQAPIDIHSGGTSLMYSTSSYDPRQGFQSKLQICIGPGGAGSVSAMRTQTHEPGWIPQIRPQALFVPAREPSSGEESALEMSRPLSSLAESTTESTTSPEITLQDQVQSIRMEHLHTATQALLEQQLERKDRLQQELRREKEKLRAMQRDVRGMEKDLAQRQLAKNKALPAVSTVVQKVQRLKQEIRKLTEECKKMTHEVDKCSDPRGQDPPRQGPPPDSDPREGLTWTCSECTFGNYWALEYCEQCEMPRIVLGTNTPSIDSCYCHPPANKLYPPSPLTTIPLMHSTSPPKLN